MASASSVAKYAFSSVIDFPIDLARPSIQTRPSVMKNVVEFKNQKSKDKSPSKLSLSSQRTAKQPLTDERGSGRLSLVETTPSSQRKSSISSKTTAIPLQTPLRLIAIGPREAILDNIKKLHRLGYAEFFQWSELQHSGTPEEFMSILTLTGGKLRGA